jgi:NAD(P)-dependent dehydrogenase (short-subunit alcohol dehydrogenase family)
VDHDIAIGAAVAISSFSLTIKSSSRRALMKDPVVLITGALTGIGRATALAFANEGGRIVASGRRDAEGHGHVLPGRRLQRVTGTFSRISTKTPRSPSSGKLYDDVAVESTTRQLASDEVAFTKLPDLLTL